MANMTAQTLGDIVSADYRTAAVLERFGLDFCCGGRATLDEACDRRGLDLPAVMKALEDVSTTAPDHAAPTAEWPLDRLMNHIVSRHHSYVRGALPVLLTHTRKIADVHGERNPNLPRVAQYFAALADELTQHMAREEQILFPYIHSLVAADREDRKLGTSPFGTVQNPVRMMEADHQQAGDTMKLIRELTDDFTAPGFACTTYRVCLDELRDFERDLHLHIHLENNILHPGALALETRLT